MRKLQGLVVSKVELAKTFNVSKPTIDDWLHLGCPFISKGGAGKQWQFDTGAVFDWRVRHERDKENEEEIGKADDLYRQKLFEEVKRLRLQNNKMAGDLMDAVHVRHVMVQAINILREQLTALPVRTASLLECCDTKQERQSVLDDAVFAALNSIADAVEDLESDPDAFDA